MAEHCRVHDYDDPGKPKIAWDDEQARADLVDGLVGDAHRLLGYLPETELGPKAADALALLALIAGQDVEPVDGSDGTDGRWRIAQRVAPDRVISVVDPDTRHAHKTVRRRQDGFKAHIAVEPDTGLITDCVLTKASGPGSGDAAAGPMLLAGEPAPVEVLADSAYGSGDARAELATAGHTPVIKPIPLRPAVEDGFTLDDFTVNESAGTVTCPNGLIRRITRTRNAVFAGGLPQLPAANPLYHQPIRTHRPPTRTRSITTGRAPPSPHTAVPGRLPTTPAHGRTLHRLAHPRQPQTALPRRHQKRSLVAPPRRSDQPTPTHHPRTRPRRNRLGRPALNRVDTRNPCSYTDPAADSMTTRRECSSSNHGCDSRLDRH